MKTAFTTLGCPEWSWEKIMDEAARLGYDGIEIRGLQGEMFVPRMAPFLESSRMQTMAELEARGLRICCFDTSCVFHDPAKYEAAVEEGKATIDLARQMGVPYVRVFGDAIPDRSRQAETIAQVARGLQTLCRHAEGKQVAVLLETHGDFAASEDILAVASLVEHECFGVLWDINNPYKYGQGESIGDTYNALSGLIRHTHFKDTLGSGKDERIKLAGEGDVPMLECLALLHGSGYDGWISFEWEKKWHPSIEEPEVALPQFIDYIKRGDPDGNDLPRV